MAAVGQGNGLPYQAGPAKEEKHETGTLAQARRRYARVGRDVGQYQVLQRGCDAGSDDVEVSHVDCPELASMSPVQRVVGIRTRLRHQDNVRLRLVVSI